MTDTPRAGRIGADENGRRSPPEAGRLTSSRDAVGSDRRDRPTLVVLCGLPGVGKTTVAERIAARLDATLLRTDVVRKELFADPAYTGTETRLVYDEVFERGRQPLERGHSVVLDGTFKLRRDRRRARTLAAELDAGFDLVHVECDEATVRERIAGRVDDESDADFRVHLTHRAEFERLSMAHVTIDTSADRDATYRQIDRRF